MLTLSDIAQFFPEEVRTREKWMLREYLQYIILSSIYTSKYSSKLVFLGGTCLRIAYQTKRFSEDLDFDNRGMSEDEFALLWEHIVSSFRHIGIEAEMRVVYKWAYYCYIRIPRLLHDYGISGYQEEKILIQLDTVPQPISYVAVPYVLSGFGVRATILVTPRDVLLSQKIVAAYKRKRTQGRDFYDISYLEGWGVTPYYPYLEATLGIHDATELLQYMHEHNRAIDFASLTRDVEPFLFRSEDLSLVRDFPLYIEQQIQSR